MGSQVSNASHPLPVGEEKQHSFDPKSKPPPFGHQLRKYWAFEEGYVNLNNGSYGSLPLPVLTECSKLTLHAETNPDKWMRFEYMVLLDECRGLIADLVGAKHDEIVFVPNATHGVNTVLRNFEWKEGDVILGANTTYGAVARTIKYVGDRADRPGPFTYTVDLNFPTSHSEILDAFRARVREIKQLHPESHFTDVPEGAMLPHPLAEGEKAKNKFIAVIDSLVSNPGALLPWKEMVKVCHEEGVWALIDGAHSIGQEPNINLTEANPDFWVSNCHKWLFAKRGCAAFYVPKRNQHLIKSSIPTSFGYLSPDDPLKETLGTNFVVQHGWTGTMDFVPYISTKSALEFRKWLGGEQAIHAYCHKLAIDGGSRLAEILNTKLLDQSKSGEQTLSMVDVMLPLPADAPNGVSQYTPEVVAKIDTDFRKKLLYDWNMYVAPYFHNGAWWCRCSAQVWNEVSDFEYAGKALLAVCSEIEKDVLPSKA